MATHHWESFVFGSDNHGDQCDPDAVSKFHEFCEDLKPKHRIHGGDLFDFRPLRRGASAEEKAERIEMDIAAGREFLEKFRPDTLLLGNHDMRLWEALDSNNGMVSDLAHTMIKKLTGSVDDIPQAGGMFGKLGIKNLLPYHRKKESIRLGILISFMGTDQRCIRRSLTLRTTALAALADTSTNMTVIPPDT